MKIVLASASPRRQELLKLLISDFIIDPSSDDERIEEPMEASEIVRHLATRKAMDVYRRHEDCLVIGSDTVVELNGEILGKPANETNAFEMLRKLSGKTHNVHTGLAFVYSERKIETTVTTKVTFSDMTDEEIQWYLNTKEPFDKAGAYGIQGLGARFIKGIEGDYYTVMGFPVRQAYNLFTLLGLEDLLK